jgi:hypothetical protein
LATQSGYISAGRHDDGGGVIVICEPQCKEFSHEKFNSGFIYGLRLAFPQEKIKLYADITHIQAIKDILLNDKVSIGDIEYVPIEFGNPFNLAGIMGYYLLLKKLFSDTLLAGTDKIFFLSFNSIMLFLIKWLKQNSQFSKIKFTFVLHGDFENIADDVAYVPSLPPIPSLPTQTLAARIHHTKLADIPGKALHLIRILLINYYRRMTNNFQKNIQLLLYRAFPLKRMLLWKHSDDFKYIVLSPHILINAAKYIEVDRLNFHTVVLPTVFAAPLPLPDNQYPKFAVFGYGNSLMMYQILIRLAQKKIEKPYEIRIIGMDNRGTAGFENITAPSQGKTLSRAEMEKYVMDIDTFLMLYQKDRHRLGCSGSILEALSYMKPVLHFDNDCINTFNTKNRPIGICSNTIDEYVDEMVNIITNYPPYVEKCRLFRANILKLRNEISIESSTANIRNSFTWPSAQ